MSNITNEIFNREWAKGENRRILSCVARRFRKVIPPDEIIYHSQIALFSCLNRHKDKYGTKFTSSLYRFAMWEFIRAAKKVKPLYSLPCLYSSYVDFPFETVYVRDCLDNLSLTNRKILVDYYINKMTLREIGKNYACSPTTAMILLRRAEKDFQRVYTKD